MRYLLLILIFASCTKSVPVVRESCNFGLTEADFSINKALKKPKHNEPPPPPPNPSYPGQAVIFLDFDGHTVTNTNWNINGPIVCQSSGLGSFQMAEILDKVITLYSTWDVLVTTDSNAYHQASYSRRTRVIFTTSYEWFGNAGGTAFVGSFTWGDTPCFVFTSLLGYSTKYIKEAACHEVGHTIGLYHQSVWSNGVKIQEYNYGGCGSITGCGAAPVMGCAYYQPISLFTIGTNTYGNIQDDKYLISLIIKQR